MSIGNFDLRNDSDMNSIYNNRPEFKIACHLSDLNTKSEDKYS